MTEPTLAARRKGVLDGIADETLAEQDEAEARRERRQTEAAEAEKRRQGLIASRAKLAAARYTALAEADRLATEMVIAIGRVFDAASAEHQLAVELGEPARSLAGAPVADRLGRYLSTVLKTLPGATPSRFGGIRLVHQFRPAKTWAEAERQAAGQPEPTETETETETEAEEPQHVAA